MKKFAVLVVLLGALAVAGALGWRHWHGSGGQPAGLELSGNVDIRQISLAFDGSGRVVELRAEEGDSVKAGAVLGRLDVRALALQAQQIEAQIEVQQQNLLRLRAGVRGLWHGRGVDRRDPAQPEREQQERSAVRGSTRVRRRRRRRGGALGHAPYGSHSGPV
jgi:HlyD family secretion protein